MRKTSLWHMSIFLVCFVYEEGLIGFWTTTVKHSQGVLHGL